MSADELWALYRQRYNVVLYREEERQEHESTLVYACFAFQVAVDDLMEKVISLFGVKK